MSKLKNDLAGYFGKKVTHGVSDWASSIVAIKKTNGDNRLCIDHKIGVNPQISSDSFPLPSIEIASHEMANMKHFAKIDLKSAYNQIERDDKFKEIIAMKTPMGLLTWFRLPFGIKTVSHIF